MIKTIKIITYLAIFGCLPFAHAMDADFSKEQIIGTQGFKAKYQFTKQDVRVEQATRCC